MKLYYVKRYPKISIDTVEVARETEKMYYFKERSSGGNYLSQVHKSEIGKDFHFTYEECRAAYQKQLQARIISAEAALCNARKDLSDFLENVPATPQA